MADDKGDLAVPARGSGGGIVERIDDHHAREDMRLRALAIRKGWLKPVDIPDDVVDGWPQQARQMMDAAAQAGEVRDWCSASKCLAEIMGLNLRQVERMDTMDRLDTGAPTEIKVVVEYSDKHVTFKHDT